MRTTARIAIAAAPRTGSRDSSGYRRYEEDAMRSLLGLVAFSLVTAVGAQTYPTKTVRLISGVTPGSASDTMARILAEKLSASLGQPVIVENRLGAGGLVGAEWVATQEPDRQD